MTRQQRTALMWILLASSISIFWGSYIGLKNRCVDFRAVYYGTQCLLQHHNPYSVSELESISRADSGERPSETVPIHQSVTLYVNMPTTFIFVAPFAMLPWGPAHLLWLMFTAIVFILAAFLAWNLGARYAPDLSLFLICIVVANSETIFSTGNTAGIVISLCVVAVWCFLEERFVPVGILCMAVSLAIKPHDAGLVWLFFLLAGGVYRKRALQTLVVAILLGLPSIMWVSHVAPHWMQDWQTNLATISAHGGINDPSPASIADRSAAMVVDLQAAISIFRDDPRFYNPVSYLVCGALLLAGAVRTLRSRFTQQRAWLGLAAIVPLTMLVTYHKPWDAKLLMLAIPACAILWAEGGMAGRIALLVTTAGVTLTGDIPLALLTTSFPAFPHDGPASISDQTLTLVLTRPASIILLAMGIFYLWVYLRHNASDTGKDIPENISAGGGPAGLSE